LTRFGFYYHKWQAGFPLCASISGHCPCQFRRKLPICLPNSASNADGARIMFRFIVAFLYSDIAPHE
jgi:hypothetical protein